MKKPVLYFYLLLCFLIAGVSANAQVSVTVSSTDICLGDQVGIEANPGVLPTGVTVTKWNFDVNNDGTFEIGQASQSFAYIYPAPGNYTIKVEAELSNGNKPTATINVIVYRLPIPSAIVSGSPVQCFRGNLVTLTNTSTKTDNRIYRIDVNWGDATQDPFPFPTTGQVMAHSYNAQGQYNIKLTVTDSIGCFKDTIYPSMVTIKNNITPSFNVVGTRDCDSSRYVLNNTTPVPFSDVKSYTWDFGDGQTDTRVRPFSIPVDQNDYLSIPHWYKLNGTFLPALIIEDITGCIDSFRMDINSTANKPENVIIKFDTFVSLAAQDIVRRDSVCWGKEGDATMYFKQTPNPLINPSAGELLWNFGDPPSQQLNTNNSRWELDHTFVRGVGPFTVTLRLSPAPGGPRCTKTLVMPIEVLGPRARIQNPPVPVVLDPTDQNQCVPFNNYYNVVDFVNTSEYYKSEHVFTRWDFGDDVAPQCTSFLVPNVGYPPLGGWVTAADQYNFSTGYWRMGNKVFPGKRLDCRYSADTLPLHRYTDWDLIYKWYRYGHDFMPWDFNRYTRNPADTLLPLAQGGKLWVQPWDTLYWGKPVYLNPNTGEPSLTQSNWQDPFTLQWIPWPRIDTIQSRDENGQPMPQDLVKYNRFTLRNGAPDPLAGFWGDTKTGGAGGGYGFVPRGTVIDPIFDTLHLKYTASDGSYFKHHYDSMTDPGPDGVSLYHYMFKRGVQACHTVELFLKDSQNHVGKKTGFIADDFTKLDSLDCEHDDQVQLRLMKPDARGLGKRGVECPGNYQSPDRAGILFTLGPASDRLGDYPGISPDCGQSFIRFNHDSMADRLDQTPCILDGFVDFSGGTTPGGLLRPIFTNQANYGNFAPPILWTSPFGTSFWYHYGPGAPASGFPLFAPANPTGDVTVGLIVGTGDPTNPCLSDTIWYHNFLNFSDMDDRFFVDPTYHPVTNAPTNGQCKLYCKNSEINFVYFDSTQRNIKSAAIQWGDNSTTVDSFYYGPAGANDGYFVNGFRRVRYQIYYGPCGEDVDGKIYDSLPFPNGLPGVILDTIWTDNYTYRIYDAGTNPFGSLIKLGRNVADDSTQWEDCGSTYWVADADTLKTFYLMDIQDRAKMLLPVKHKYWSSSWEDDCKRSGALPRAVSHTLTSTKECKKSASDSKFLVRGVIDSAMVRNSSGQFENIFCRGEAVHFYDSIRYWAPNCEEKNPPPFGPLNAHPITGIPYNDPFDGYDYDTIDYWRDGTIDINEFQAFPDPVDGLPLFVEKVKWYFGDGDSAMITRPIHKYKNPGKYTVTLLSKDKKGCWDTSYCVVYVTEPLSTPVVKPGLYNCGQSVTFYDRSTMKPLGEPNVYDSISNNYWFFGERLTDTLRFDAQTVDTPVWPYRMNGTFRVKLVVESFQGCKDTGFVNVYISGPRPKIKVISDLSGCAPFTIKVVNLADVEGGQGPNDKPTKRTDILWGVPNASTASLTQYDTVTYTYQDSGTYYIFAQGDDNNPMSNSQGCRIITYPDTTDGLAAPIKIEVKRSYPADIDIDKEIVCVDLPFLISNKSDTVSYTEFKYAIYRDDSVTLINTVTKPNTDNRFTQTIADTGNYIVTLEPTQVAPGLPFCRLFDTVPIRVVRPYASFTIDSTTGSSLFGFTNTSVSSSEYTWSIYRLGESTPFNTVDKVESDRNWSFDFQKDTGDVVVCLEAFTPDPAKPICVDRVCDTISYRFIIELEIFNVFTPNGDGKNDKFDIDIQGETEYDLVIYNRWGTKVFESKDASKDWDGTNMNEGGAECPNGTYFYVFKYGLRNGEKKTVNGTISLLREK